ncbi:MAG: SCO1664 family protein [Armatimonadetes bacterium]|nr:SCO1664 family protein [Anaerolineae bacterium]
MARVLEVLMQGEVSVQHGAIRWSSNYAYLLSVEHDDLTVMCVYKPRMGERPLWDFPDGTLCQREYAAFLTSQQLGWQVVPPTVLRDGPRGVGSMQFFIEHDPEHNYFSFDESLKPQLARLSLFDCLVNNADRKGGHCLVDPLNRLWGIDHGLTFNMAHKLRTVVWDFAGQAIPKALLADVQRLYDELSNPQHAYTCALQSLLAPSEIMAYEKRIQRVLKSGRYPKPGSGPNYPWPPV